MHVVRRVGTVRYQGVKALTDTGWMVKELPHRRPVPIVEWQEVHKAPNLRQSLDIILKRPISNGRLPCMGQGTAQFLSRHHLIGYGLHHVRPGDEHVGRVLNHEDEIRHRRRIDGTSSARSHDDTDLRYDT